MKTATLDQVQAEIKSGADINDMDMSKEGWTPFIFATALRHPNPEIITTLI